MTKSLLLAALFVPSLALAVPYEIDPAHSQVGFEVRHMMSKVRGRFKTFKGTLDIDDKALDKSKVNVEIEAASINTDNDARDKHLRSADFFQVDKTPKLTFVSKSVKANGPGKATVTGDLTMRGVTKEVKLEVSNLSAEQKDPWGQMRRAAVATTTVNRKDFGLNWNKVLEAGGFLVGDDVTITLEIEMTPPQAAAKK
jgi:polyisoprenoid-binding protein YceI